jgi:hypothetical protein
MGAVYIVVTVDNAKLTLCEVYAGVQSALGRAYALAHYSSIMDYNYIVDAASLEQKMSDGSLKWVFLNSNNKYIAVHYKNILISSQSRRDPLEDLLTLTNVSDNSKDHLPLAVTTVVDPVVTYDDPYDDALPSGWGTNNKPATMKDLWEKPADVKSVFELTSPQKWALAKARISKRPNYHLDIPGLGIFDQARALRVLNEKTIEGEEVMEDELEWLEDLRNDRYNALLDDEKF